MTLRKYPLENIVRKGENAGNQHFLLFPQCFLPKASFNFWYTSKWSSANAFNLDRSKICSFGKELTDQSNSTLLTHYQTTNFRLFQIESLQTTNSNWRKWKKVIQTCRKRCGKKEKLLVTSNFSFSHSVFKRLVSQGVKRCHCVGRVNSFPKKPWFLCLCSMRLLKTL